MLRRYNVIQISLTYLVQVLITSQWQCLAENKFSNNLEYPEIGRLVSWSGKDSVTDDKIPSINKNLYEDLEDYREPADEKVASLGSSYDGFMGNEDVGNYDATVAYENNIATENYLSTSISNVVNNREIGVGPLKFIQEHNMEEYEFGNNIDAQHNKGAASSSKGDWKNYLYFGKRSDVNNGNLVEGNNMQMENLTYNSNMHLGAQSEINHVENSIHQDGNYFEVSSDSKKMAPSIPNLSMNSDLSVNYSDNSAKDIIQKPHGMNGGQLQQNIKNYSEPANLDVKKYFKCNGEQKVHNYKKGILPQTFQGIIHHSHNYKNSNGDVKLNGNFDENYQRNNQNNNNNIKQENFNNNINCDRSVQSLNVDDKMELFNNMKNREKPPPINIEENNRENYTNIIRKIDQNGQFLENEKAPGNTLFNNGITNEPVDIKEKTADQFDQMKSNWSEMDLYKDTGPGSIVMPSVGSNFNYINRNMKGMNLLVRNNESDGVSNENILNNEASIGFKKKSSKPLIEYGNPQWIYGVTEFGPATRLFNISNVDYNKLPPKKLRHGRSQLRPMQRILSSGSLSAKIPNGNNYIIPTHKSNTDRQSDTFYLPSAMVTISPQMITNLGSIFAIPTPMTMLPSDVLQMQTNPPQNVTKKECYSHQQQFTSTTESGYNKVHKAVPVYLNANGRQSAVNIEQPNVSTFPNDLSKNTATEYKDLLIAEAVSEINNPEEAKNSNDKDSEELETSMVTETQANNLQVQAVTNVVNSEKEDVTQSNVADKNVNDVKNDTTNSFVNNESNKNVNFSKKQEALNTNQKIYGGKAKLDSSRNTNKLQTDKNISELKKVHFTKEMLKNFSNNFENHHGALPMLNRNIKNGQTNGNDEIVKINPYSQWKDDIYDDRNRRGVDCGCFPAVEDLGENRNVFDDLDGYRDIIGMDETIGDRRSSESNYYTLMGKNNPKSIVSRLCNNWAAEREGRALLKKKVDKSSKIKENNYIKTKFSEGKTEKSQQILLNEENNKEINMIEDGSLQGEQREISEYTDLRPMKLDDPELSFVRHPGPAPSRTVQSGRGGEISYDEDIDAENNELVTHTPVKYVKWHNISNGALGGYVNLKQNTYSLKK